MPKKSTPRYYKLRRNAEKRLAVLSTQHPDRRFYIAPASCWRWAIFTDGPNGPAICL